MVSIGLLLFILAGTADYKTLSQLTTIIVVLFFLFFPNIDQPSKDFWPEMIPGPLLLHPHPRATSRL